MASADEPHQSELKKLRDAGLISEEVYEAEAHQSELKRLRDALNSRADKVLWISM